MPASPLPEPRGMQPGEETDAAVAELMEPRASLPTWTADEARLRAWGQDREKWPWWSCDEITSPGGWWHAEIGTSHGRSAADDHTPVRWHPEHETSTDIAAAWLVVDEFNDGIHLDRYPEFVAALRSQRHQLYETVEGWLFSMDQSVVAHAICLAALAALTSETAAHV